MSDKWWETDVPRVMTEAEDFYTRLAALKPEKNKLTFTKTKTVEVREWASTLKMYDKHFEEVLKQLGFFYVPNRIIPGPTFVFPIKDSDGKYSSAQTRPLEGSVYGTNSKYRYIGIKPASPRWLGNDYATLKKVIETRTVVVVEGPFDILAARLMCPDVPIMSPLTKTLGRNHLTFLRMLGVKRVFMMFDNEEVKIGKKGDEGAGNMSMEQLAEMVKTMKLIPLLCPKSDPSSCLQNPIYAEKLRAVIKPVMSIR
jgi:hypothetical protein